MKRHYTAVCGSRKMNTRPMRRVVASVDDWGTLVDQLIDASVEGYDPIYELTEAGDAITNICVEVEKSEGVWIEPSVQAGDGIIVIYDNDDNELAYGINYRRYNSTVISMAIHSANEQEFREKYRNYLKKLLDEYRD